MTIEDMLFVKLFKKSETFFFLKPINEYYCNCFRGKPFTN